MSAHGKTHWIKLYVEMLDDPKIGLLTDDLKWRFVSVLLLAGELNEDGFLPETDEMAWTLRVAPETLAGQLRTLAGRGLVELRLHPDGGERWFVSKFSKRQSPSSNAERQRQWRKRNADSNAPVTKRNAKVTPEYRIQNTETEEEDRARETETPPDSSSSPLLVLQEHFTQSKAIFPNAHSGTYDRDWQQPLTAVLERAGGDVVRAAAMIDAALDVAAGNNEQGKTYTVSSPRSLSGIIANLPGDKPSGGVTPETIWERVLSHLNANKPPDEPRLLAAVKSVGWPALMAADEYSTPRLKSQLFNAYRSAPA